MIASGISSLKPEAVASKVSSYKKSRPEDNFQFQLVVIHVVAFLPAAKADRSISRA